MASIWDDPDIDTGGGYFRFDNPGDKVAGHITAMSIRRFQDGQASPQLTFAADGTGEEVIVTAGSAELKGKLRDARPAVGDWVSIELTALTPKPGRSPQKHWEVQHRPVQKVIPGRVENATTTPAAVPPTTPAAAPAPAPADGLTDEQRAALDQLTPDQRAALGIGA